MHDQAVAENQNNDIVTISMNDNEHLTDQRNLTSIFKSLTNFVDIVVANHSGCSIGKLKRSTRFIQKQDLHAWSIVIQSVSDSDDLLGGLSGPEKQGYEREVIDLLRLHATFSIAFSEGEKEGRSVAIQINSNLSVPVVFDPGCCELQIQSVSVEATYRKSLNAYRRFAVSLHLAHASVGTPVTIFVGPTAVEVPPYAKTSEDLDEFMADSHVVATGIVDKPGCRDMTLILWLDAPHEGEKKLSVNYSEDLKPLVFKNCCKHVAVTMEVGLTEHGKRSYFLIDVDPIQRDLCGIEQV